MARFAEIARSATETAERVLSATYRAVDVGYSAIVNKQFGPPFFESGWGTFPIRGFGQEATFMRESVADPTTSVRIDWRRVDAGVKGGPDLDGIRRRTRFAVYEAHMPAGAPPWLLPHLPVECHVARVRLVVPEDRPVWGALVHLPATGDHTLSRRDWLTRRLLHHGVAALVLEGPYYGARVPEGQAKSRLRAVTDLFKLGRVTIEEGMRLACWAEGHLTRRVGLAGLSMGGVHACMAASLYPRPVACVPCITPHSAAPPYVMGPLSAAIAWDALRPARAAEALLEHCASDLATALPATREWNAGRDERWEAGTHARLQDALAASGVQPAATAPAAAAIEAEAGVEGGTSDLAGRPLSAVRRDRELIAAILEANGPAAGPWEWDASADAFGPSDQKQGRRPFLAPLSAELYEVLARYTDVTQFPRPLAPHAVVSVAALDDAYVRPASVLKLARAWAMEVRWVPGGHVSAFVSHQQAFLSAMRDALARL